MKKSPFRSLSAVFLACSALLLAASAGADVPRTISYQGYLTDGAGQALTGPTAITFRLYEALEGGEALWAEGHGAVELAEGRFTVALGSVTALELDFAEPMFLEIQVGNEVLAPRLPLRSVPYAIRAATVADGAVTNISLAPGAITKDKLAAGLAGAGLAQNEDGSIRVAAGGIDGSMLADGAIRDQQVAADAAIAPAKIEGTAVTLEGAETLANKTLVNPVVQVLDTDLLIADAEDQSYGVRLDVVPGRRSSPTNQVLALPDQDGTLALQSDVAAAVDSLATVARTGLYSDLGGTPTLSPVASTGSFADLTGLPGIFTRVTVLPGGEYPVPPNVEALNQDDTLTFEAEGPIALSTVGPRTSNSRVTIGLRTGAGLSVNEDLVLDVGVDQLTIGMDEGNNLQVVEVPAERVTGLATVATSGSYPDLANRPALADIATSGSFADLADVPAFAELGTANRFAAPGAITLAPTEPAEDMVLLEVLQSIGIGRPIIENSVFSVDAEGDVIAASYTGSGAALTDIDADNIAAGTIALARIPAIPAANVTGLADVATSGSFEDLPDVPDFARRDQENVFTASARAILLQPSVADADAPMLQLMSAVPARSGTGEPVFSVDAEGDVTAASVTAGTFFGDGTGLTMLDASALASGTVPVDALPYDIPAAKINGLATIATSGSFEDLSDVPDFARRDEGNVFTASDLAISIEPAAAAADAPILRILDGGVRGEPVFSVDAEGDVTAASVTAGTFFGDGTGLTMLDASALASGTVPVDALPYDIPAAKINGLATIATSGSFEDLSDVPDFARRDEGNVFTASDLAISIEPAAAAADAPILRILDGGVRGEPVFSVDAEGDVTAASVTAGAFFGDGAGLTMLDADSIVSGTLAPERLPANIPGNLLASNTVASGAIEDGTVMNDDIAEAAAISFGKLDIQAGDISNELLANDSFVVTVSDSLLSASSSVALGGVLELSIDRTDLASNLAGFGLTASLGVLSVDDAALVPAMASSLPGAGLMQDIANDTIAVNPGDGLAIDGANALVPNVDNETVEVKDGQLAVKALAGTPIILQTTFPDTPKNGSIIFLDGALQVYNDPDGDGPEAGAWIKVGTYQ